MGSAPTNPDGPKQQINDRGIAAHGNTQLPFPPGAEPGTTTITNLIKDGLAFRLATPVIAVLPGPGFCFDANCHCLTPTRFFIPRLSQTQNQHDVGPLQFLIYYHHY